MTRNDTAVCGGRIDLKILVRYSSEMWKYLVSKSSMIFTDPLMCWEGKYNSLLMALHTNHCETVLWSYSLTGSNDSLYTQPRAIDGIYLFSITTK